MKKHSGNMISWSSVFIVLFCVKIANPALIAFGICIAAVMDMFDGKLARMYGENTAEARIFGELTDSLCDVINFGVAPGFLLAIITFNTSFGIIHLICSCFFVWAGIYRLARFSATKDSTKKVVDYYTGIPITVAGPLLGLLTILFTNQFITIIFTLVLGWSMVSNIKIKKLKI